MLITGQPTRSRKPAEDLHVAGEGHQLHVGTGELTEQRGLAAGLSSGSPTGRRFTTGCSPG